MVTMPVAVELCVLPSTVCQRIFEVRSSSAACFYLVSRIRIISVYCIFEVAALNQTHASCYNLLQGAVLHARLGTWLVC
jgi:hypothetical protein